jgi:UDP-N-acetylglucosamine--N-acetylmuramyl-(pentapeptide) pyrophosphoryl-undecaprenol N-acetylglucosamine transferase
VRANAVTACKKIYKEFKPDAVIGTGGYASFPALYAAQSMGIPTCVHEANALPGVTTKLAANKADRVLVAFEESCQYYKKPQEVRVVGMPIKKDFTEITREEARNALGLTESDKLVVSAFGSLGAKVMNETMADMMALEKKDNFPFRHIHATGSFGKEWMPQRVKDHGVDWENCPQLDIREYIYDMPVLLNAADVVIGRAGSGTCNELGATGAPCILVPSPNVTNNHQEKNARVLETAGAVVMLEKDVTAEKMYAQVMELLGDDSRRAEMSKALKGLVRTDSADAICDIVEELIAK